MSGDNLHGKQPIKFYSEKITLTKVQLLEKQLSLGDKVSNLDEKHKEWSRKLSGQFIYIKIMKMLKKNKKSFIQNSSYLAFLNFGAL